MTPTHNLEKGYRYDRFPAIFDHNLFETELILNSKLKDVSNAITKNNSKEFGILSFFFV